MADFTLHTYSRLLQALIDQGYHFQTFAEFLTNPSTRSIVLRHDVDARPQNSLVIAKMEHEFRLKGTYNFRIVPQSWDEEIILEIASLGHEIGYHYEELSTYKGKTQEAFEAFKINLEKLRKLVTVSTICMHGSPKSKYDSRDLWKHYDYKDLGIIGEPYLDVDFSEILYLTDTGRRWDGEKVSIRDKVNPTQKMLLKEKGIVFRKSRDIIETANKRELPDHIMINIHPQRWHREILPWVLEWISQNLKNMAKRVLNLLRK